MNRRTGTTNRPTGAEPAPRRAVRWGIAGSAVLAAALAGLSVAGRSGAAEGHQPGLTPVANGAAPALAAPVPATSAPVTGPPAAERGPGGPPATTGSPAVPAAGPGAVAGPGVVADPKPGSAAAGAGSALLEQLKPLLPAGRISLIDADADRVRFTLDDGTGPGMVQFRRWRGSLTSARCLTTDGMVVTCRRLADGHDAVITRIPGNCVQAMVVDVDQHAGTVVEVQVSSCLAWNGTTNPLGRSALTESQAIAIADDPRWRRGSRS